MLKDLDTADSFPCCNSEVEFIKKPFIDHNSGRAVFPGQVERLTDQWRKLGGL